LCVRRPSPKPPLFPYTTLFRSPTREELENILSLLKIKPIELVRTKEAIWKEKYKDKDLSDKEVIETMLENPRLIERPIVIKNNKAAIGRPPKQVLDIL